MIIKIPDEIFEKYGSEEAIAEALAKFVPDTEMALSSKQVAAIERVLGNLTDSVHLVRQIENGSTFSIENVSFRLNKSQKDRLVSDALFFYRGAADDAAAKKAHIKVWIQDWLKRRLDIALGVL